MYYSVVRIMAPAPNQVTQLLAAWRNGDEAALEKLMPLVYDELRRRARRQMGSQQAGHTLQPTALIHEAFLKLAAQPGRPWHNRAHFIAVAAQAMRQVLVDYARSKSCGKRSGDNRPISLDENVAVAAERADELVALDDALSELAKMDPRKSRVVVLRYFGGLSVEEVAEALGISSVTVMRDWRLAKAWLWRQLSNKEHDGA